MQFRFGIPLNFKLPILNQLFRSIVLVVLCVFMWISVKEHALAIDSSAADKNILAGLAGKYLDILFYIICCKGNPVDHHIKRMIAQGLQDLAFVFYIGRKCFDFIRDICTSLTPVQVE